MRYLLLLFATLALFLSSCGEIRNNNNSPKNDNQQQTTLTLEEKKKEVVRLQGEVQSLKSQITAQEEQETASKALWVGRIAGLLAIVCLVGSFFLSTYPIVGVVARHSALILGGVSVLAFLAVKLVPYLTIIGIIVGVIVVGVAIWGWMRDRTSLVKVIKTVEEHKELIPDYKNKFKKHIDAPADKWINKIRGK